MDGLSKAIDITDNLIAHIDGQKSIYLDVNMAHERLLGYRREELIGKDPFSIVHPEDREGLEEILIEALSEESEDVLKENVEYRLIAKNNDIMYFSAKVAIEKNNLYVVAQDVTLAKEKEKSLKYFKNWANDIVSNIDEGVYVVDIKGKIIFANEGLSRMLEIPPNELVGMNYKEFSDERYVDEVYETFKKVYETQEPQDAYGWKFVKKGGKEIEINTSIKPHFDNNGQISGFFGVSKDLTQYTETLQLKTAFETFGAISDDLNQSLTIMIWGIELLFSERNYNPKNEKIYENVMASWERAKNLVQRMNKLNKAKKYSTKTYLNKEILDLDADLD